MSSIIFLFLFPGADYLYQQNFETASRYYNLISSIAPSYEVYYNNAICAIANGDLDKTIELCRMICSKKPECFYCLGIAYYQLGRYEQATKYFDLCRRKNIKIWQTNYYLGLINLKQNRIAEAMQYLSLTPNSDDRTRLINYVENYNQLVTGQERFRNGQYQKAFELYESIEDLFGFKELGLAMTLAKMAEYQKSLDFLDTVINYSPDSELISQGLFEAGKISLISNNLLLAQYYLKKYIDTKPDNNAQFLLGRIFWNEAKYDTAATYFRTLPDSIDEYLFYKGRTDYFLGSWGKAEEQLLRHREIFPNSIYGDRAIHILASINFKREEYNQAINFWQELTDFYPKSAYAALAIKGIGDAYFNIKKYRNALKSYRRVKEYGPTTTLDMETNLAIYETQYCSGKYPSLVDALRSFIEENPNSNLVPKTHLRIAKILFEKKEYYQSLAELDKLIEGYPESPVANEALIEKARVCERLGKTREMKNSFQYLLAKENAEEYYAYAANELGDIYSRESKNDSALYYYNLLLESAQYRERAMFEIANIYHTLGQNEGAVAMINKLITEYPSSVFLLEVYILWSRIHKSNGNYPEAINILNELMQKIGPKPELYIEIGNSYFELGDYPNARDNYLLASEQFKQNRDESANAMILAGDATMAIGDKKNAHAYYLQANLIAKSLILKNQATAKMNTTSEH